MCLQFFAKRKKKHQLDALQQVQKIINLQLRTFTNHLAQISSAYEAIQQDLQEIKIILKEKNK